MSGMKITNEMRVMVLIEHAQNLEDIHAQAVKDISEASDGKEVIQGLEFASGLSKQYAKGFAMAAGIEFNELLRQKESKKGVIETVDGDTATTKAESIFIG